MKKKLSYAAVALLFVAGACVLFYPLASDLWNQFRNDQLINSYVETVSADAQGQEDPYAAEFDAAAAYNSTLIGKGVPDAFAVTTEQEDAEYEALLNVDGAGLMGYIKIPKIKVSLPIHHTTDEDSLATGVGHLQGSALPVGGASTHCVLSAHRGLPSAALFTDLDQLEEGDHFYIYVYDRALAYEVDQVLTVEPEDTAALDVSEGKDYCTLVTCTPYGVNTQRLLVRGHRIAYSEETAAVEEEQGSTSMRWYYVLMAVGGLAAVAAFVAVLWRRSKKRAGAAGAAAAEPQASAGEGDGEQHV